MRFVFLAIIILFIPGFAHAQVTITEVMYDLDGSDADREWIEVYNGGSDSVSFTEWHFNEGDTNHLIKTYQGGAVLPADTSVVIADDPEAFLADWPDYTGILFDSAFSLKNTGEALALTNSEKEVVYEVSYDPSVGADGDGNSLQWNGSAFTAGAPTPGTANVADSADSGGSTQKTGGDESDSNTTETTSRESSDSVSARVRKPAFEAEITGPAQTVAGAYVELHGTTYDEHGIYKNPTRYLWSFGDGTQGEGEYVSHTYKYPGEYVVFLTAGEVGGELAAGTRHVISVSEADVAISAANSEYIAVSNEASREIDLSLWYLAAGDAEFTIPKNTIVLPEATVRFDSSVTNLSPDNSKEVVLRYPNKEPVAIQTEELQKEERAREIPQQAEKREKPATQRDRKEEKNTRAGNSAQSAAVVQANEDVRATVANKEQIHTATATASTDRDQTPFSPYILALAGILGLSVIVVLLTKSDGETEAKPLSAEDFTIIEENTEAYARKSE